MELEQVKQQTTWNDAAESINSNNLKIITEVTKLQNATYKNKGYFTSLTALQSAFPSASSGSKAYVGTKYPYAIYLWQNEGWVNSGHTGGEENVNLSQFYTKEETDSKITETATTLDTKLTELSAEMGKVPSATLYEKGSIGTNGEDETSEVYVRSNFIACHKGDVVSGKIERIVIYDAMYKKIANEMVASTSHTIATENCAYIRLISTTEKASAVTINNVDANHLTIKSLWTNSAALQKDVMSIEGWEIPFNVKAWNTFRLYPTIKAGLILTITSDANITLVYLKKASDGKNIAVSKEMFPYTTTEEITEFQTIVDAEGILSVKGVIDTKLIPIEPKVEDVKRKINALNGSFLNQLFEKGSIGIHGEDETSESYSRTNFIPCQTGDIVKGILTKIVVYDNLFKKIAIEEVRGGGLDGIKEHTIITEKSAFIRVVAPSESISTITINGIDSCYLAEKEEWNRVEKIERDIMTLDGFDIPFNVKGWNPYRFKPIIKKGSTISISANVDIALLYLMRASDESLFSIRKEQLPYTTTEDIKGMQTVVDAEGILSVKGVIDEKIKDALVNYTPSSGDADSSLNALSYIAMPIPQLAIVNIVANNLPTTKVDDIKAVLEFDGRNGNKFKKKIIINAQGNSSLAQAKKNFSIDIMDENYDDSHKIKFGNWVAQDGFHLKSYVLDGIRVKAMAAYDIYESIILHNRTIRSNRVWKRSQLPNIPITGNTIEDIDLQLDGGAKGHPSGFPVIVNFNGEFYGIYCWQLKKHRDNYHQKKSVAEHIHLDGVISENLLWNVNGNIDWDRWSGKKAETDGGTNFEGAEIRNPKKLILVDGTEYDGDTNRGELIATTSPNYDATNEDMIRTASVRASIESLSRRVYSLTQMSKGAEKKAEIAKVFDVDSIIDYIIFGQLVNNWDGYRKNWQWTTHDGIKWAVNAYDLDSIWGWTSWGVSSPSDTWIRQECPPIGLIIENYLDEMKARYAELRSSKIVSVEKMMQLLVQYVQAIGVDYYEQEYEKWEAEGVRDNLWRFEVWMEKSIESTDKLMGFVE